MLRQCLGLERVYIIICRSHYLFLICLSLAWREFKMQNRLSLSQPFSVDNLNRQKELSLKQEATTSNNAPQAKEVDQTTKKMIIDYQQLKRRKQAHSRDATNEPEYSQGNSAKNQEKEQEFRGLESANEQSPPPSNQLHSPHTEFGRQRATSNENSKGGQDTKAPSQALFQMGIVGYREKRQKSELEQELEASLRDVKKVGYTDGFNSKTSAIKAGRMKNLRALGIDDERDLGISSNLEVNLANEIQGPLRTRKLYSQQKRGTRKKILASGLKKTKEFKEKTNTIEHVGGVSRGLDSNFQIEGRRLIDQIEIDNQSGGTQGNLLNNVDDLADGFNGSNFDMQSVHGMSQNQYAGGYNPATGTMPTYGVGRGVLSQTGSNQAKRITQMQQYQYIKGNQKNIGFYDGQMFDGRPLSHGQNWHYRPADYNLNAMGHPEAQRMHKPSEAVGAINSIEALRDDFLNELPKSINLHSNPGSGRQQAQRATHVQTDMSQNPNLHDVSFKVTGNKPIPFGKPRLETLSGAMLANVCKFLKPEETMRLTMTTKRVQKASEEKEFDSLWVLFSFQTIFSKTGLTGLRNSSQRRIDEALHQMHFQCESIRRDSKEVQVSIFEKWLAFSLIMVLISLPVLLVLKHDFQKEISLQYILLPCTISWGLLLLAQLYAWYRISKYYTRVTTLHLTQPQYMLTEAEKQQLQLQQKKKSVPLRPSPLMYMEVNKLFFQKAVRGRNTQHCSLYTFPSFINRFAMMNMLGLSFVYLAFFLKIYILHDQITYLKLAPLAVAPLLLMYLYEMITEVAKDRSNWSLRNAHFAEQVDKAELPSTVKSHTRTRRKINCGLIPNFILFAGYHGGFFAMLCMRLDGQINTSYFVILVPLWVFLVYIGAFLVISGLASTNQRVNKCERIFLSVLVPIGFILTIVIGLCLVDDYASFPVYWTFVPLVVSLIFSYLYVRCLVKPSKPDFIKVKPEQQQTLKQQGQSAFQESQQRFQIAQQQTISLAPPSSMPVFAMQTTEVNKSPQPQVHPQQIGQGSSNMSLAPKLTSGIGQNLQGVTAYGTQNSNQAKPPLPGVRQSTQTGALQAALQQQSHAQSNVSPLPTFQVKQAFE